MDKSNEILFNESALYSLKRAQLTALCKRYSLKQSGKNEELVSRLQVYAQSLLDKEKQSSDTTTSNDADGARDPQGSARTSQQWEIVEDGGEEDTAMNSSRSRTMSMRSAMSIGTLKSLGSGKDFAMGSISSKSSGSVSSSLMSIANSLKRAGSKSSKMSTSTSRTTSSIDSIVKQPMAHLFPTVPSNIPCNVDKEASEASETNPTIVISEDQQDVDRPITESVIDASKLQKEQSTIRLVTPAAARLKANASKAAAFATPKLKPYSLSDPKEDIGNAFLAMDDGKSDIGNAFLAMDGHSFTETAHSEIDGPNTSVSLSEIATQSHPQEATTSLTPKKSASTKEGLTVTTPQFVFGSPANAVSNAEFGNAAAAILEEMNKRLGLTADAPAAMKIGADGTINFGELTPSGKSTLNISKPKFDDARFGRAHDKVFQRMNSIADHYSVRRPPSPVKAEPLIGTKRKSMAAFGDDNGPRVGANKRIICLDDPKDKTAMPPPPKRQRVDGADLAKMEKASVTTATSITIKEDEAALKKAAKGRRSSKGRTSTGGSAARRRSAAPPPKVAPSGRFGLLRGAAKVVKNIISTVSHGGQIPASSSKAVSTKPPVPKPTAASAPVPSTSAPAPAPKAKQSLAPVVTRPSTLAPRASATASANTRKASQSTTSSTRTSLAPKASVPPVTRAPRLQRGSLPVFDAPAPAAKKASSDSVSKGTSVAPLVIAKKTNTTSRVSVVPSTTSSRRPSAATGASIRSAASRISTSASSIAPKAKPQEKQEPKSEPAAASLASKLTLDSVQESPIKPGPVSRDPDFDPAPAAEDEGSRPSSPLPAPPASLSSRPLQRRQPLEPLQPDSSNPTEGKGSLGRRPRISRSKVIAKVHANRLAAEPVTSSIKGPNKGRKSGGASLSAKAKLMGGEGGVKGRASVAAAAEAAKRKARLSNAVSARRRTFAVQQAAAQV